MSPVAFNFQLLKFYNDMTQVRHLVALDRVLGVHALRVLRVHGILETQKGNNLR